MTIEKEIRLSLIAAVARNGVIGRGNRIPWRLPSDLKRFKALTMGHPVVMGRRTFQSIGRPLPGRENVVLSRHALQAEGVTIATTLGGALAQAESLAGNDGEVFVIGGADLYAETIGMADGLYITEVDAAPDGDAFFPRIDPAVWRVVSRQEIGRGEGDSAATAFAVYQRRDDARLKPSGPDPK